MINISNLKALKLVKFDINDQSITSVWIIIFE